MSRLGVALATLACVIGLTVAPAPSASADSAMVGEPGWSVTLTFPDMQWSSAACQHLSVSAVVTGSGVESWTFGGSVSHRDDGDEDGDGSTWFIDYDKQVRDGTGSFTSRHAVLLCPSYDSSGMYDVDGEVGVKLTGAADWSWLPYRAAFSVSGIPTTTTLDSIAMAGQEVRFSGRTTATPSSPATFRGCSNNRVIIEVLSGSDWEAIGDNQVGADGNFVVAIPINRLTGTQYRATSSGGSICASSSSGALTLPVRLPKVSVTSLRRNSVVKVDIDPNMGRRDWRFQLQRQSSDETWKNLRTYRTRGSQDTRTINQRQGTYRIHVLARFGYAETYSDTIYLER